MVQIDIVIKHIPEETGTDKEKIEINVIDETPNEPAVAIVTHYMPHMISTKTHTGLFTLRK